MRALWGLCALAACGPSDGITIEDDAPRTRTEVVGDEVPPLTELCINEFMPDNESSWLDDQGVASDWVELHNPTDAPVSLDGYFLTTDIEDPFEHALDAGLEVAAGGFLVLSADNLPELGPLHLSFSLSALGESVGLFRLDGAGEVVHFGGVEADVSWSRTPNCCADVSTCMLEIFAGTPGESNP